MKLSYNKVFNRYAQSFSDRLAEITYSMYRVIRMRMERFFPLSENEKYCFSERSFLRKKSADIPCGFDYIKNKEVEGFVALDYVDIYDYLPKEELSKFLKEVKTYVRRNKINPFSSYRTREEMDSLDDFGKFYDGHSFSQIITLQFSKNKTIKKHCSNISISVRNLSATFLLVKYRVYITEEFNAEFAKICKTRYVGCETVCRQFNIPWYAVKKFGKSYHTGNNVRQEEIYQLISQLKWEILKEIRSAFSVHFLEDEIFPPTFETYSTNIRPSKEREKLEFWDSILFDRTADYAPEYNACVCWDYKHSKFEGIRLAAYCGGNYNKDDHLPEIVHHDISDIYGVYLVAATLGLVSDRDIAICNKKISKAIRKEKTSSVLKVRVEVERKLYYSYRFVSEFSGKSIEFDEAKVFRHQFYKRGSVSSRSLEGISEWTEESKRQIDNVMKLLNDAAEYRSSESNIKLQWVMMIVTVLSLLVAWYSIKNNQLLSMVQNVFDWLKRIIAQVIMVG